MGGGGGKGGMAKGLQWCGFGLPQRKNQTCENIVANMNLRYKFKGFPLIVSNSVQCSL